MTPSSKASRERPADRFIALAQQNDSPPDLAAFLAGCAGCSLSDLADVIAVDQYWRWMLGSGVSAETYLEQFPKLAKDAQLKFELILGEYCVRKDVGREVDADQLVERFPELRKAIVKILANPAKIRRFRQQSVATEAARRRSETMSIAAVESQLADETFLLPDPDPEPEPEPDSMGETFGRYRIVRKLGEGTMGTVYLAGDPQLDRQVALKIPKFKRDDNSEGIERFYREARIAAGLRSANICPVYDVGDVGGVHYISMAYIEGRLLSDIIVEHKRLRTRVAAMLVRTLATALHDAHLQGIVHRDLKPSNIIIDERNRPVIMDFGLARETPKAGEERLTADRTIVGSPAYMSPELIESDGAVGPHSDMFSLGVLFYELLSGRLPFQGSFVKIAMQIVSKEPRKLTKIWPDIDDSIERVCFRMMAKKVEDRYPSMEKVVVELSKYLRRPSDGSGELPTSTTPAPTAQKPSPPPQQPPTAERDSGRVRKPKEKPPKQPRQPSDDVDDWLDSDGELFTNVDLSDLLDDK